MSNSYIDGDEILYRCVFYGKGYYDTIEGNRTVISSQAFADREMSPSVDRAILRNFDPSRTQKDQKDGVVDLLAKEVRLLSVDQRNSKGDLQFVYKVDVVHRPLDDNIAHSQIESNPMYKNSKSFRKLREKLSYLVNQRGWVIKPYDLR